MEAGALRSIVDGWFFTLEEDVLANGIDPADSERLLAETERLMQSRLSPNHGPVALVRRCFARISESDGRR